ncbi:hypothetical protein [Candidatus Nanosyncoccus alces]|uniref:Sporulation stage II protein D amidase enhancer LytB N-terminal domain-containing protein n=1 Tax=Candidatus Nanosyncoccus alces TaxID=2171997 RepID=A0ABY0FP17_9BACT|nr:hypothetical protein [Candidatus Nanosyncoccus alces]RYC74958.1 hypothetical protein G3RUM_00235 [Candidatus Nanosyncoccus alces]
MRIRRSKRIWAVALGVFVAVFLFTFLTAKFKDNEEADAANLGAFDAGYIISDYQMSNYNAMNEAEIQSFLTAKNPCANNNYSYYLQLSANKNYTWHWANGHFVCLSEERFGDGETIGSGDTAAHIIWQAAQDYRINPQVLIVLLQKETGLITDPIPNNGDYRKATGYGCPDTAACSSKYYGFKNQVRNAAALFRTVLDGGWTNYPLGNNYVQYNPNAGCGGSVVNIRSLATSALYRYTPYQPNAAALNAGYGYGDGCSAYGNRNFYSYFEDWFGGIKSEGKLGVFGNMVVPRLLYVKAGARYIDPNNNMVGVRAFSSFEYFTHLNYFGDRLCLSIGNNKDCYIYSDLEEIEIDETEVMAKKRILIVSSDTNYLDYKGRLFGDRVTNNSRIVFTKKININGQLCLQTDEDVKMGRCVPYYKLQELPNFEIDGMAVPREIYVKKNAEVINLDDGISEKINGGERAYFTGRASWFGELCLQRKSDEGTKKCIPYSSLREVVGIDFSNMTVPRFMKIKVGAKVINAATGEGAGIIENEKVVFFDKKVNINEGLCLKSSDEDFISKDACVLYSDLGEVENFSKMVIPRYIVVKSSARYQELVSGKQNNISIENNKMYFVDKININGNLCLRTEADAKQNLYRCIMYTDLEE